MYQKIADELIDKIEKGELRSGDKLPTEVELGEAYGVSRITVTHAIRTLQNRNLVYRVKGSGTFISKRNGAGGDARSSTGILFVSVIFPQGEQYGAHETLMGIESECAKGEFFVTFHNSKNKHVLEHGIITNLLDQGCGGIIIYPCFSAHHNAGIFSDLVIRDFPVVFIDRHPDFLSAPFVACDNGPAMRTLVAHLIERGHRRIGFFCNSIEAVPSEHERFKGYCEAHIAAGLHLDPGLVFRRSRNLENPVDILDMDQSFREDYAGQALSHYRELPERPTCIAAVNDGLAMALMRAALARGIRVPSELAITGFDDLNVAAHLEVPLTTIRQPFHLIGSEAARLLMGRIRGNARADAEIRVPAEVVIRDSAP